MRPIRQWHAQRPALEEAGKPPRVTDSRVLVWAMVGFLVLALLCLGAALAVLVLPDSRFHFDPPWFDFAFSRLMGLATIFAAMSAMMKLVINLFRRE